MQTQEVWQMAQNDILMNVLSNEANALIRDEMRAAKQRKRLERAAVDAVRLHGAEIDAVSAATGLTPAEIRVALENEPLISCDLAVLSGAC